MRKKFHHSGAGTVKIAMHFSLINFQTLAPWIGARPRFLPVDRNQLAFLITDQGR
jgi:hypothetical protein